MLSRLETNGRLLLHFTANLCIIAIFLCRGVAMSRQKETEHVNDILLFNRLLSSMNHQLISATPEKKEAAKAHYPYRPSVLMSLLRQCEETKFCD